MAITYRTSSNVAVQTATPGVTIPSSVAVGDFLITHIMSNHTGTLGTPSGWTLLGNVSSGSWTSQIAYKIATVSDASSTVSWTVSAGEKSSITIAAYTGVDQTTPLDVSSFVQGTASSSHATPSITVTQAGWMLSFCSDNGSAASTSLTPGGGFTTRASAFGTGGGSNAIALADSGANVSNGAQTAGTWTATISTNNSTVASVALRPASTAGITGTVKWFGRAALRLLAGDIDFDTDTLKVTAHTSTMSPNLDTWDFYNDVTNELSTANGYTAGGKTITNLGYSQDASNHRVIITCDPVVWTASGTLGPIRYFVVRKDTGVSSTSPLLFLIDCGTDASSATAVGIYPDPVNGLEIISTPTS